MAKVTRFLFRWQEIEAKSDLARLKLVLDTIPDETLMRRLEAHRGKGRNDYPVRCMWNAVLAGVVYQHHSIESLRRELMRNAELRQMCGFDPFRGSDAVPPPEAFTHFFRSLHTYSEEIDRIFDALVEEVGRLLPDFGKRLGVDSKGIRSAGRRTDKEPDGRRDTDADWGCKTYRGTRLDGSLWRRVKAWFGYKLHLLVDTTHELPVGFDVTRASAPDVKELSPLMNGLRDRHPEIVRRARYLSADKAYDSTEEIRNLHDNFGILPVIDIRNSWQESGDEVKRTKRLAPPRQLNADEADNILYDVQGNVFCMCLKTLELQTLALGGYDRKRDALKYICPVKAYGMSCRSVVECPHANGQIRIKLSKDRRIFTPLARSSYAWKREYRFRSAVERVNGRLDVSFGFEQHFIRGLSKMKLRVGIALIVMLAMAVGHIRKGRKESMRSLVKGPWPDRIAA